MRFITKNANYILIALGMVMCLFLGALTQRGKCDEKHAECWEVRKGLVWSPVGKWAVKVHYRYVDWGHSSEDTYEFDTKEEAFAEANRWLAKKVPDVESVYNVEVTKNRYKRLELRNVPDPTEKPLPQWTR